MSFAADRSSQSALTQLAAKLAHFRHLVSAVLLQDMRSRFGASYLGYLIAIAWPLTHMGFITAAYFLRTQVAPVGDSPTMFVATGVVPYILCFYPARTMALAIAQNRQLLNIPVLKPFHILLTRCVLEILNAMVVLALFLFVLYMFDVDIMPNDLVEAAKAIGAAVFLGIGLGFLNVILTAIFGSFFMTFFVLVMIGLYLMSGVFIPTWMMPEQMREYAIYNPLLNVVEWLRSAYYTSYDAELINKPLVLYVAGICLALGLVGERYVRGRFFR
ncbi:ABC transporter permease [Methylocystis sp. ATCC 49242]|uniref:ABC transporter permease n=1 Tax=Methylocystis sp. ATCC 49242 TaxID=622637 RepID=UPI0001F885D7|nr:ABC transporter permease [Methylocystis sp. ATCC 49242]